MKIENYLSQLQVHLRNKTAIEMASLLNIAFLPKSLKMSLAKQPLMPKSILPEEWLNISSLHLKAAVAYSDGNYEEAFKHQREVLLQVQKIFASTDSWILPVVHVASEDLWKCAQQNKPPKANDDSWKEEASRLINRSFNISLNDRSGKEDASSRKMGVFRLINLLFRIYYDLDQLNLCHNLLKVLKNTQLPALDLFPKAHLCTFHYFHGRTLLISGKFQDALLELEASLFLCSNKSERNALLLLELIVPLKILVQSQRPPLVIQAKLPAYIKDLVRAIAVGDYERYFGILEYNSGRLYALGSMFAWQRLGLFCRRNAILRIFNLFNRNTRLPFSSFAPAFYSTANSDEQVQPKEEFIIATFVSLIGCGLIKAYAAPEKKFVVFSAKDPFPTNIPASYLFP